MALWSGFCFSGLHPQSGPPGRPLWRRALTILPALMGFLAIDGTLAALTLANSLARMAAPDPASKGVRGMNGRILVVADGVWWPGPILPMPTGYGPGVRSGRGGIFGMGGRGHRGRLGRAMTLNRDPLASGGGEG